MKEDVRGKSERGAGGGESKEGKPGSWRGKYVKECTLTNVGVIK